MLKNVSVGKKQALAFLSLCLILIMIALTGYFGITKIRQNFRSVIMYAPLIDAAMEMKLSVATDKQILMEILASKTTDQLNAFWNEHLGLVKNFDIFADAILNGADTRFPSKSFRLIPYQSA